MNELFEKKKYLLEQLNMLNDLLRNNDMVRESITEQIAALQLKVIEINKEIDTTNKRMEADHAKAVDEATRAFFR